MPENTRGTGSLTEDLTTILRDHADCRMVTSRTGQTIWSCGVRTPQYDRESTVGFVDLHRAHLAAALAAHVRQEQDDTALTADERALIRFTDEPRGYLYLEDVERILAVRRGRGHP